MSRRSPDIVRFPPFTFDSASGELHKNGRAVKLHRQPARVLALLLRRTGEVVRREDIQNEVWGEETHVDFDLGINSCIRQIRIALGDDADDPRYVQTLPGVGYRFIAPVESLSLEERDSSPPIRKPSRRNLAVFLAAAVILALPLAGWHALRSYRDRDVSAAFDSIAVLPLENLSGNPEEEYFAEGMTEALIAELANIEDFKVISRNTMMRYKNVDTSLPEIARTLDVDVVLEGSVLRVDERIRFTVQLIDARRDRYLWAQSYEREAGDILSLQRDVALAVASELQMTLSPEERRRFGETRSRNPRAHDSYLKGLYLFHQAVNESNLAERVALHHKSYDAFEEAIRKEPTFAEAHAALARSYHFLASIGHLELYPLGKAAALKALEIDDDLAEAHNALAFILLHYDWDWRGAEGHYRRAIATGRHDRHGYALFLSAAGRHAEAMVEIRRAEEIDPLSLSVKSNVAGIYLNAREYEKAEAQIRHVIELAPDRVIAHVVLARLQMLLGRPEQAISILLDLRNAREERTARAWGYARVGPALAVAYALAGETEKARSLLQELELEENEDSAFPYGMARAYTALSDRDSAFRWLDKACERRSMAVLYVNVDPFMDGLRTDDRFDALLRRINLAPPGGQ